MTSQHFMVSIMSKIFICCSLFVKSSALSKAELMHVLCIAYAALCDLKQQSFGTDSRGKVMIPVLNHTQGKCHVYVMIASSSHQPTMCDISEDKEDECNPEDKASDETRATMVHQTQRRQHLS